MFATVLYSIKRGHPESLRGHSQVIAHTLTRSEGETLGRIHEICSDGGVWTFTPLFPWYSASNKLQHAPRLFAMCPA